MKRNMRFVLLSGMAMSATLLMVAFSPAAERPATPDPVAAHAAGAAGATGMIAEGRQTFRYDTFGDQVFWSRTLGIHEALKAVSPRTALSVGLKVDAEALPPAVLAQLRRNEVDLDDPAVTAALLQLDAVVGLRGFFKPDGTLRAAGITCALCHSTVDNSVAPGIGRRLDGWPNRDLNVGAVINLAPNLKPVADLLGVDEATVRTVLRSWGPGRFDAELFLDGKAFRPDGKTAATLLPPAFGLAGVDGHTYTGWGSVTYWNAFVANLEMHGQGTFWDPRLNDAAKFPIAARNGFGDVRSEHDLITSKLPALQAYQLAIPAPAPPAGSFDAAAAARGKLVFSESGCARCHVPPLYTEPGWNRHKPEEIGIDSFQADRSPDGVYRTTPLKGLWTHTKGGFYHDGRFATLLDVVNHYDAHFALSLSEGEKRDLVEFLKSL
jgi:cytochrome c553